MGNCCFGVDDAPPLHSALLNDITKDQELPWGQDPLKDGTKDPLLSRDPLLAPTGPAGAASGHPPAPVNDRAFVVVRHAEHGFLLLQCTKKKKGVHYQIPGGHIDRHEVVEHGPVEACRVTAARELWEETGIDVRGTLDRLRPLPLTSPLSYKGRAYFELDIGDADSATDGVQPLTGERFLLQLSREHTGWSFQKDSDAAARAIQMHSGGHNSRALREAALIRQADAVPSVVPPPI